MAALVQRIRARAASLPTFDIPFLLILLLLLSYGLIMLFSAGYAVALYRRGDAYTYIRPQLLFAALGVLAMYAASLVDYHVWHRLAWPMLGISLLLLAIVLFMPEYNGCKRWIVLPGLGTLQPSEIAKFSIVLAFRAAVLRENFAETGGLLAAWLLPWRHIWYLYALIFWHLTLPVLCRLRDRLGLAGSCLGMALAVGLALAAGLVDWPFTLVRVFAFYPFYACGVLLRPQLDRLAAFAAEHRPVRLVAAAGLVLGYGAYFFWVLRADPIMDHSAELFHDVSYAGGDRVQYRVVFYLVGIVTTAALTVLASRRHLLAGLGRHTLAIYLLHLPVQALLVELGLYDLMRGKATIVVVLWSVLLAAVTLAVLNLSPVQRACDAVANCWYKRK